MSKGMWTKQYTKEGKTFYYNAAQNKSVWTPPMDSIVHEAPYLKKPEESQEEVLQVQDIPPETDAVLNSHDSIQQLPQAFVPPPPPSAPPTQVVSSNTPSTDELNRLKNHEL
jgi:hypothetical protein